jgi:hypothetical protein
VKRFTSDSLRIIAIGLRLIGEGFLWASSRCLALSRWVWSDK